jgi:hypothetical protein
MAEFVSYQRAYKSPDETPFSSASPNLQQLARYLQRVYGLRNLGIYNKRPIRGGTSWSSHAYGAALDSGYLNQDVLEAQILPWLIEHSKKLGVQRIHHYRKQQIWTAGKGWENKSPGEGDAWIHIEVHPDAWADARSVDEKLEGSAPAPAPAPASRPTLRRGDRGPAVVELQKLLGITADGDFGKITDRAVRDFQTAKKLTVDGIVGPKTWKALGA